jgi:hypothetical protein
MDTNWTPNHQVALIGLTGKSLQIPFEQAKELLNGLPSVPPHGTTPAQSGASAVQRDQPAGEF